MTIPARETTSARRTVTVAVALLTGQVLIGGVLALVTFGGGSGRGEVARPAEVPVAAAPVRPSASVRPSGSPFTPLPATSGAPERRLDLNTVPGSAAPPAAGLPRTGRSSGTPAVVPALPTILPPTRTGPAFVPPDPAFVPPDPVFVPPDPVFVPSFPAFAPSFPALVPSFPGFEPPDQGAGEETRNPEIGDRCRREGAADRTAEGRKVRCERGPGGRLRWLPA